MDLFFQEEMPAGWDKNAVRTCWVFLLLFLTRARQISQENLPSCPALLPNPEASSDFFFFFPGPKCAGRGKQHQKNPNYFPCFLHMEKCWDAKPFLRFVIHFWWNICFRCYRFGEKKYKNNPKNQKQNKKPTPKTHTENSKQIQLFPTFSRHLSITAPAKNWNFENNWNLVVSTLGWELWSQNPPGGRRGLGRWESGMSEILAPSCPQVTLGIFLLNFLPQGWVFMILHPPRSSFLVPSSVEPGCLIKLSFIMMFYQKVVSTEWEQIKKKKIKK